MTDAEFEKLETLINKLSTELGGNPICILNRQIHDGWHIGVYDKRTIRNGKYLDGYELGRSLTGANLKTITQKLNEVFESDELI